jgi:hypothetical protein
MLEVPPILHEVGNHKWWVFAAMKIDTDKLVTGAVLLETIFHETDRPKMRWLQYMCKKRVIPYYKIGHLVRFDVAKVRAKLEKKNVVQAI